MKSVLVDGNIPLVYALPNGSIWYVYRASFVMANLNGKLHLYARQDDQEQGSGKCIWDRNALLRENRGPIELPS